MNFFLFFAEWGEEINIFKEEDDMIKLLLVEDDANLCYIIRGGLEDMIGGYEVMTASNGEEGLKIWKEQHLDIIISDIEMPVMDGYEWYVVFGKRMDLFPLFLPRAGFRLKMW